MDTDAELAVTDAFAKDPSHYILTSGAQDSVDEVFWDKICGHGQLRVSDNMLVECYVDSLDLGWGGILPWATSACVWATVRGH